MDLNSGTKFLVPNVISAYLPALPNWLDHAYTSFVFHLQDTVRKEAYRFWTLGYKVDRLYNAADAATFDLAWKTDGITGFLFAGHGAEKGMLAVQSDPGSSEEWVFRGPSSVSLKYRLAHIHVYACYSAEREPGEKYQQDVFGNCYLPQIGWIDHWSGKGTYRSFTGAVNWFNFPIYSISFGDMP